MSSRRTVLRARRKVIQDIQLRFYGVALLCVALALGMTLLLLPCLYPTTTPLFLTAVMVSQYPVSIMSANAGDRPDGLCWRS